MTISLFLLIFWFFGIVFSALFLFGALLFSDNKKVWEMSAVVFITVLFTGFITTIPLIIVIFLMAIRLKLK